MRACSDLRILDLYSGCGGFSLGAHRAGFRVVGAIDIDPDLTATYSDNFPGTRPLLADLSTESLKARYGRADIDGIIGGPPCQGFSEIGRQKVGDPRNRLVWHFFHHVSVLQPRFFVMENVRGLLFDYNRALLDDALSLVKKYYDIYQPIVLDAADFGAPTKRRRVIIIGTRKTEGLALDLTALTTPPQNQPVDVDAALRDFVGAVFHHSDECGRDWWAYGSNTPSSAYASAARALPEEGLGSEVAIRNLKDGIVSGHRPTEHSPQVRQRFANLAQGKKDPVGRHYRLKWDGLSPTLRAGTGADQGRYQSVRPIHPDDPRVITPREAARLQGFPDWFLFHPTTWHSFRMIGNSVSPLVATAILRTVREAIERQQPTIVAKDFVAVGA